MTKLGKLFEEQGGQFERDPVPGFTTEMMNKLRAEILAGNPPACSQLKGPEIAAWSKIAPVNLNDVVREAGYEAVVARSCETAQARRQLGRAALAGLS